MARPRKDNPPDQFTSTEVAVGAGLSARNLALLQDRSLAPETKYGTAGKASARFFDTFGLGHAALIGAFHRGGVDLLPAGRLAHHFADHFGSAYGRLPSHLDAYLDKPLNPNPGKLPWEVQPGDTEFLVKDTRDDFWLHHFLRSRPSNYVPGKKTRWDLAIEIVDRQYVFEDYSIGMLGAGDNLPVSPAYRIVGWERGGDADVRPIYMEVKSLDFDLHPECREEMARIEREFIAARDNAISLLRINVSLAIRNALDAIHDHRAATGTALDWNATAKPPPGRYDGADERGYPLDPAHPWNRNLGPAARALRLQEIEEYVTRREAREKKERGPDTS